MNSYEAKKGLLTLIILLAIILVMAYVTNVLFIIPTNSTTNANGELLTSTPSQNTMLLVGVPIIIIGVIITLIKQSKRKGL